MVSIAAAVLIASTARAAQAAPAPAPTVAIHRLAVAVPDRDDAQVEMTASTPAGGVPAGVVAQRLTAAGIVIPLAGPARLSRTGDALTVAFDLRLADVPEAVLALDPNRLPLRWEGLSRDGTALLAAEGKVDLGDPGEVALPVRRLYDLFTTLHDLALSPGIGQVGVHVLLGLYNPFSFDFVATHIEYHLTVGGTEVLAGERPGFRLKARQVSDVLIEQDVPMAGVAGGLMAAMQGQPASLTGSLTVRTPRGDRVIPLAAAGPAR